MIQLNLILKYTTWIKCHYVRMKKMCVIIDAWIIMLMQTYYFQINYQVMHFYHAFDSKNKDMNSKVNCKNRWMLYKFDFKRIKMEKKI